MPGLLRGMARTAAVAGTATAVSNRVSRRQSQRWAAQDQAPYPQDQAPPSPAPPASNGESRIEKLKDLGALKEQGILTDAEFEAEKARILS
jgi:putative oligomerization/nucleic acid binding protein